MSIEDLDNFKGFPKMGRLFRDIIVTEKIDGTNAQVVIYADGERIRAGSRKRRINAQNDHFAFARFVDENRREFLRLGPGRHFGEWWGHRVGRGYDLPEGERRFSLFNTERWSDDEVRPKCCHVVPVLYEGPFSELAIRAALSGLESRGSAAAPGFMDPEGVVIYHASSASMFKYTLKGDGHKTRNREGM